MSEEEIEFIMERLHSPAMHCRQCDLTRKALNHLLYCEECREEEKHDV